MQTKKMRTKKHLGTAIMVLGLVLVLAAACLTAYNLWDENRAERAMTDVLTKIDALEEAIVTDSSPIDEPEYIKNPEMEMPVLVLDGKSYIGVIEVPVLGLRLPIMSEWSYPNLKISPSRYTGSIYMNNMVIAGHNYRSHFSSLKNLRVGDQVLFTDVDGNQFDYRVAETEIVAPTEIEHMTIGDWDLTLFTCTYGGRTRFTVRCVQAQ